MSLEQALPETDVLYITRLQRERFSSAQEFEKVRGCCVGDLNDCPAVAMAAARELCPDSASADKSQGEDDYSPPTPSCGRNQVSFNITFLFIHFVAYRAVCSI